MRTRCATSFLDMTMTREFPLSDRESKAQRYGAAVYPRWVADALTSARMARHEGLRPMLRHAYTIGLIRAHALAIDRRRAAGLPHDPCRRTLVDALTLRAGSPGETAAASAYSQVPAKVFQWSLEGLRIDLRAFDFIDFGSGRSFAVMLAARYPFRSVTGVEFARELHEDARANIAWLQAHKTLAVPDINLVHASVLEWPLPARPSVFFLYNPFTGAVMEGFLDRLVASLRTAPRPHWLLYLNNKEHELVTARGFNAIPLSRRARLLLRMLSPFDVQAYRLDPEGATQTASS